MDWQKQHPSAWAPSNTMTDWKRVKTWSVVTGVEGRYKDKNRKTSNAQLENNTFLIHHRLSMYKGLLGAGVFLFPNLFFQTNSNILKCFRDPVTVQCDLGSKTNKSCSCCDLNEQKRGKIQKNKILFQIHAAWTQTLGLKCEFSRVRPSPTLHIKSPQ